MGVRTRSSQTALDHVTQSFALSCFDWILLLLLPRFVLFLYLRLLRVILQNCIQRSFQVFGPRTNAVRSVVHRNARSGCEPYRFPYLSSSASARHFLDQRQVGRSSYRQRGEEHCSKEAHRVCWIRQLAQPVAPKVREKGFQLQRYGCRYVRLSLDLEVRRANELR